MKFVSTQQQLMNYPGFTNEEIATVVAYSISSYPEDARRRFRATIQKEAPPRTTLIGWAKRFKATLCLTETARVGDHSDRRLSDDKREEIVEAFGDDPTLSQRKAAQFCNVSQSSVNRVLKSEGLRAWKFTRVQEISEDDKVKRLQFCNFIRREQQRDNHFVDNIWLWGYIRDKLYRDPRPRTLAALQDRLTSLLDDVEVEMIRSSYRSFLRRCELCSENRGGHFEQFL